MRWDGRIIYTRHVGDDFSRILIGRRRTRVARGIPRVLH